MSDTTVIKSFLVQLGFKQDEASLKKFASGIETATASVFKLALAVEAAALGVAVGVARFANNLEHLYFASMRTGMSATGLKAYSRAAQDFGASAEEAQGSVEALASFLRKNPGGIDAIGSWFGIHTRDENGKPIDTESLLRKMAGAMQHMETWRALQAGGQVGLSDNTILAMMNPEFLGRFDTLEDRLGKAGFGKAAIDAHKFMMDLRDLGDQLVILGTRIYDALGVKLGWSLERFSAWIDANSGRIIQWVLNVVDAFDSFQKIVIPALEKAWDWLVKLDKDTDGWSTKIIAVVGALTLLGGGGIIGGILGLAAAFVRLGAAMGGTPAVFAGAYAAGTWLNNKFGLSEKINDGIDNASTYLKKHGDPKGYAMKVLGGLGWNPQQAAGIVANLGVESEMQPDAEQKGGGGGYGLAQWDATRQAAFKQWAGHDIHGSSMEEQLAFVDHELRHGKDAGARDAGMWLKNTDNSMDAGYYFAKFYERMKAGEPEALRRGQLANDINHEITMNLYGVHEPQKVADLVVQRLARTQAAFTREFAPKVQ